LIVSYAVPFIDSMSPLSAAPSSGEFTLYVYGAGFVNGYSQIYWNGVALVSPTTCTATQCSATVPAGDIATPGTAFVTVVNAGVPVSNVFFFTILGSTPSVSFTRKDYTAGNGPSSVAVADFRGIGKLDLAVANSQDNTVSILLGNGDGTFQTQVPYSSGGYTPVSVAVGDFKNNGNLDLAVVNACGSSSSCTSGTVSILLGNGDGTFTLGNSFITSIAPTFVAVGDFNADGNLDLAVANGMGDTVYILLGDGTGNFTLSSAPATGVNPTWVVVGDFNNDGILDLAVANAGTALSRGDSITVLLGNGDGTFTPTGASPIPSEGYSPVALGVGVFNSSFSDLDLAVANACGTDSTCTSVGKVAIQAGNGGGAFTYTSDTSAGTGPSALAVADLNADGNLDVAVADAAGSAVSILLGDGLGDLTLQTSPASPSTGASPFSIAKGDFNGDGGMDLVTANEGLGKVSVLLQAPTVTFACPSEVIGTCTIAPLPGFAAGLSFGSETASGTTVAMNLTLTNSSNLPLSIGSIGVTVGSPTFTISNNTCPAAPATLAASAFCTLSVTFSPASTGGQSGLIEVSDNAPGSPQLITLKGTGTAPTASALPTLLPFGNVSIPGPSAAQTVTLSNTSAASLTINSITVTGGPFIAEPYGTDGTTCTTTTPLGGTSSCLIAVTFNPSTTGLQTGTLKISDGAGTQSVSLTGTGVQAVSATPGSLTFTNQIFGSTSVAQTVTLSNPGSAAVSITGTGISILAGPDAGEFAQTSNCGSSVPAYGNCTIYVTFTPSATGGAQTATLNIVDNAGSSPQTVSLSGTGIKANTSTLITSNTPNPSILGQTVTVSFTVTASPPGIGTPTTSLGPVTVSDGRGDSCTGYLTAGTGSCVLTPTTWGAEALTASYPGDSNFNASTSPGVSQKVTQASTTTAITSPTPTTTLVVGQPVTVSVKVTPAAADTLLSPTGTVKVSDGTGDSCVVTLTPGGPGAPATGSCNLTPTKAGTKTLTASYSGDRNFCSSSVSLTNALAAIDFSISLMPGSETITPGKTDTSTLTLVAKGGFTGTVSLTCIDPHVWTTCNLGSNSVSLVGTVPIKVTVVAAKLPFLVGTSTLEFIAVFGSGSPATGGLTRTITMLLTENP
jgi:hypothetical protein